MHKDVEKILFSEEQIEERCKELGKEITKFYSRSKKKPVLVGLLKGSVPFMAELIKYIDMDITIDFMDVSSYSGVSSTGDVRILKDVENSVKGERVLIVEDILDTGITLKEVKEIFVNKGTKDVKIVTMLDKKEGRKVDIQADFVAFDCPNEFIIGYGLDYNQHYRNLPYVGVLKKECYM